MSLQNFGADIAVAKKSQYAGFKWLAPLVSDVQAVFLPATHSGFDEGAWLQAANNISTKRLSETEHLWVFGTSAIPILQRRTRMINPLTLPKKSTIFISDGQFWRMRNMVLRLAAQAKSRLFVMPDLAPWVPKELGWRPFFQLIELPVESRSERLDRDIYVSHTPRPNWKDNQKGSMDILRATEKLGFDLTLISNSDWRFTIQQKFRSQFFVDQCVDFSQLSLSFTTASSMYSLAGQLSRILAPEYRGGLGKSGIEALHAGAIVASSGNPLDCRGVFDAPPIYALSRQGLVDELHHLFGMSDPNLLDLKLAQQDWTSKYLTREFIVPYVMND